jgi:SAM-dependent methyltransferase
VEPASDSLERLVPERLDDRDITGQATLELHVERYRYAARCLRPGRLLDLACGVGYGSRLVADAREDVTILGVDLSDAAVAYARDHYAGDRVEFRQGDALHFDDPDGFDTIVSLETVEHVPDPGAMLEHLAGLLRPGGLLIASVPTTPSVDLNPHHLHDFSEASFRRLVRERAPSLREVDNLPQVQPVSVISVLRRSETRMGDLRSNLPGYYLKHPGALLRRLVATLRFGFTNRYLTVVWERTT